MLVAWGILGLVTGCLFTVSAVMAQTDHASTGFGLESTGVDKQNFFGAPQVGRGDGAVLPVVVGQLIGVGLSLISIVFFLLMLYGGIMWMTARGNDERTKKALEVIYAAIIGIIIVMSAYALTRYVLSSTTSNACSGESFGCEGLAVGSVCALPNQTIPGVCTAVAQAESNMCSCVLAPANGELPPSNNAAGA